LINLAFHFWPKNCVLGQISAASLLVANRWATRFAACKRARQLRERIAIVGAGAEGVRVFEYLRAQADTELVGLFDDRRSRIITGPGAPGYGGTINDLLHTGRSIHLDKILVALPCSAEQRLVAICDKLKALRCVVMIAPERPSPALTGKRVRQFAGMPWIVAADPPLLDWALVGKTLFDKVLAGTALLFLAPLLFMIAAIIKLDSHGPVLFRQRRHGFNNNVITVLKFRTMHHHLRDELGKRQTEPNDPRVTRFGTFLRRHHMDELPQLLNVLRGDMSLVGPRPHPIGMLTENKQGHDIVDEYAQRHRVRPGITGLAQINGLCGPTALEQQLRRRVELDLEYIESWSMLLDLKIIAMTALLFVRRTDRYALTR
jgi:exopolysaccharide biosynthesis polyprenyl glycosylphosphotransferase